MKKLMKNVMHDTSSDCVLILAVCITVVALWFTHTIFPIFSYSHSSPYLDMAPTCINIFSWSSLADFSIYIGSLSLFISDIGLDFVFAVNLSDSCFLLSIQHIIICILLPLLVFMLPIKYILPLLHAYSLTSINATSIANLRISIRYIYQQTCQEPASSLVLLKVDISQRGQGILPRSHTWTALFLRATYMLHILLLSCTQ